MDPAPKGMYGVRNAQRRGVKHISLRCHAMILRPQADLRIYMSKMVNGCLVSPRRSATPRDMEASRSFHELVYPLTRRANEGQRG